jgi:hypothetical protein
MASQSVTKEDLETTLHNVNVLLYAVEEVLIHAKTPLPAMEDVKKALEALRTELDGTTFSGPIGFEAPDPARTLLAGDPSQRLRKNVCTP